MIKRLPLKLIAFTLVLTVSGFSGFRAQAQSVSGYIRTYQSLANELAREFGIPPAIILGVALVESSSGAAQNCKDLKNHFGIVGKNQVPRKTRYKQYESPEASFRDFCRLLARKSFYSQLKGTADVAKWVVAISHAGYSTQPQAWRGKILTTIKKNRL